MLTAEQIVEKLESFRKANGYRAFNGIKIWQNYGKCRIYLGSGYISIENGKLINKAEKWAYSVIEEFLPTLAA